MRSQKEQFKAHRRQVRLEQYAWANRRVPTESEARLWEALRGGKLGVQFRRQVPLLGRYVVDFLAPGARLVLEVDGGCHRSRKRGDERRDARLRFAGYCVLRIDAELVMRHLPAAIALIGRAFSRG